jgi:hypothetical protein
VSNAAAVLDGELDSFIEAYLLMAADKSKKKKTTATDESARD